MYGCSLANYDALVAGSQQAQASWRMVPAPKRGEVVRLIGQALRVHKDALGTLVSLEVGKIKAEGDGEVQEMIDMADFAVGLSRMLYGQTMHSERAQHRMYEQWHPLGVVGVITAFNFPVAVWAWNAFIAAVIGGNVRCGSRRRKLHFVHWRFSGCAIVCWKRPGIPCFRALYDGSRRAGRADGAGRAASVDLLHRLGARREARCGGGRTSAGPESSGIEREQRRHRGRNSRSRFTTRAIVFGAVGTAGQRCTSTRRLIVHESQYELNAGPTGGLCAGENR